MGSTAVVVIAHGSRRSVANADLRWAVEALRRRGNFDIVEGAFLELAGPDIDAAALSCIRRGVQRVVLLPYFLSAGVHVRRDLHAAQTRLARRFPEAEFALAEPLGRHDLLIDALRDRAVEALRPATGSSRMRIFYLHWHEGELAERIQPLEDAGYEVASHFSTDAPPKLADILPDVAILSLDRLPSHGRAIAEWLWEAKKRRHIPIIFAGGAPAKVAATKKKFPTAKYCAADAVLDEVRRLSPNSKRKRKGS